MASGVNEQRPLDGLRVLDLSRVLAGPYVGRMLCDLGADVVKVEPPDGDVTRKWGRVIGGLSGYYTQQNAGKRNLCVDLDAKSGPALLRELALQADVLVENFRPGVLAQFELDWARLSAGNPRLVMLSISGFGQTGPEARRPAYAAVMHAESGLLRRQADLGHNAPEDPRVSVADMNAALHGLVGLLAALHMRARTGRGQHVDISMLDAMVATDDYAHLALDGVPERDGVVINEVWDVVGGPLVLAGDFRWVWQRLSQEYGLRDPSPKDAAIPVKSKLRHEAVGAFLAGFDDRAKLLAALQRAGLAFGEVKDTASALRSPTLAARGSIARIDDRAGGVREVIQSPYRFSGAQSGAHRGAPFRGEHNREVLREWLGYADERIAELEAQGVLLSEARR